MLQHKKIKIASLVYVVILIAVFVLQRPVLDGSAVKSIALYPDCPLLNRIIYHHFHANALHLALNIWAFLSLIFIANASPRKIILAFLIASSIPTSVPFSPIVSASLSLPIIGLSGVIYALLGLIVHGAKSHIIVLSSILLPFLASLFFPLPIANALHLYCYLAGVLFSAIISLSHKKCSKK